MQTFNVTLTGRTPLLMHWDNIDWADEIEAWKNDPASRQDSKPGDDRTPAWRWLGNVYRSVDDTVVAMPQDNLMRCFMEGGAMVPVPGGRGGKTFKAQTQSGMMVVETDWPLRVDGQTIPLAEINLLRRERDFGVHKRTATRLGFSLFVKRAKVGTSKHIRVRPRFDSWSLSGTVHVWDKQLTLAALRDVFAYAGSYKGLGDWRPSSPKSPGSWGMFDAQVESAA